jgi:hypothetical protein
MNVRLQKEPLADANKVLRYQSVSPTSKTGDAKVEAAGVAGGSGYQDLIRGGATSL